MQCGIPVHLDTICVKFKNDKRSQVTSMKNSRSTDQRMHVTYEARKAECGRNIREVQCEIVNMAAEAEAVTDVIVECGRLGQRRQEPVERRPGTGRQDTLDDIGRNAA